ncbi:MAG: transcription termination factor Rho [Mariniblastus sp.]|jgi:transcription termination factor Rho
MADTRKPNSSSQPRTPGSNPRPANRRPHYEMEPDVAEKLREHEAIAEPKSIAETISREEIRPVNDAEREQIAAEDVINVTDLQLMSIEELTAQAINVGATELEGVGKRDLIFLILKERVKSNGIMCGHGTLQILPDGFGFLRSPEAHYLNCPDDIYVSPSQIRKFNLKNGAVVKGQIRPPKENERYFALLRIESVNGLDPMDSARRTSFDELTPLHPDTRIVMEHNPKDLSTRVVDLVAPIGFGQRGLIVSPPRAGKTILMQRMAQAAIKNYPEAYIIMLLIDERPEEVTDMEREVKGARCEVISSTFDEPASRHIQVTEMVLEKAKRLVESGVDVIIFLDSITRLGRAWNSECPQSGKTLSGGLDANAMQKPKAFFGSARKIEEGGSLTILATALIDTGSKMDEVIFEEFKGTGNLEIVLDRSLVDKRIWPAIDINASGTRREEKLFDEDAYDRICGIRRILSEMNPPDAMDLLTSRLKKTQTNAEFLMSIKPGGGL